AMTPARDDYRYVSAYGGAVRSLFERLVVAGQRVDLVKAKSVADFERIGQCVRAEGSSLRPPVLDPQLASLYDNGRPWIGHASIQNGAAVLG
ncbi:hypothetical protein ACRAWD_25190, partial [Caulobacter segnis]